MGIKLLIAVACLLPTPDGPQHLEVGDSVEVDDKDQATMLCRMGRAYFAEKANDPTKGLLTAAKEDVDRLKQQAAAIKAESKQRAADAAGINPQTQALIDAAVAKALGKAAAPAA